MANIGSLSLRSSFPFQLLSDPAVTSDALAYRLSSRHSGDRVSFNPSARQTCRAYKNSGKNTGEPQFHHYDHNNNLALITDQHGNILEKPLMDAYGNVLPLPDSQGNKQAKTLSSNLLTGGAGVFYLHRVKMYNMRRRFYSSIIEKFISSDKIVSSNSNYLYAYDNPVIFSDPSGYFPDNSEPEPSGYFEFGEDGTFPYTDTVKYIQTNDLIITLMFRIGEYIREAFNKPKCKQAFCKYCPKGKKNFKSDNIDKTIKKLLSAPISYYFTSSNIWYQKTPGSSRADLAFTAHDIVKNRQHIYLNFHVFGANIEWLVGTVIHEIAHLWPCDVSSGTIFYPAHKKHACCDVIAADCLETIFKGDGERLLFYPGLDYSEIMKTLFGDFRKSLQNWKGTDKKGAKISDRVKYFPKINEKDMGWGGVPVSYMTYYQYMSVLGNRNWHYYKHSDRESAARFCKKDRYNYE